MKKGFTLIELLVVIAIIAILAAILFPVFAAAREKAKQITCASNEKQIGLAIMQYVQDYDEHFPAWDRGINSQDTDTFWPFQISSYTKSTGVFQCPDHKELLSNQGIRDDAVTPHLQMINDYGANMSGITDGPWDSSQNGTGVFGGINSPGVSLAQLQYPSSTIALAEVVGQGTNWSWIPDDNGCNFSCFDFSVPHTGLSNYLFTDGHVKAMHALSTISGCPTTGSSNNGQAVAACTSGGNMWNVDNTQGVDDVILYVLQSYGNPQ